MIVRLWMLLNDLIVFPDLIPLEFDDLINKCFGYTCSKIIILRLFVQWNGDEVFVDGYHEPLKIDFLNELVHVLGKFEQALDNQTWDLWLVRTVLVFSE